jgi:hypothetical protein
VDLKSKQPVEHMRNKIDHCEELWSICQTLQF